ncbi:hypothetical protein STTU_p0093 (plasmid) [Streptomyces sp. Tu6071]|nr:hypothetical protein STTU_p0093 [Streptomyces sp. Tu6071]
MRGADITEGAPVRVVGLTLRVREIEGLAGEGLAPPPGASPRARGRRDVRAAHGASPRARGRRAGCGYSCRHRRSIPGCAGPTYAGAAGGRMAQEHPRVRGADLALVLDDGGETGASPRARGRPHAGRERRSTTRSIPACAGPTGRKGCSRSIPACAGPTCGMWILMPPPPEHPRVRGADLALVLDDGGETGASPRARGRPRIRLVIRSGIRSIPALAGPTATAGDPSMPGTEHPRARGADGSLGATAPAPLGASPRSRGRRPPHLCITTRRRSIPALAGPTAPGPRRTTRTTEHPRARGADLLSLAEVLFAVGASPRSRGRLVVAQDGDDQARSIPALAGPTGKGRRAQSPGPEHPRARGADCGRLVVDVRDAGASPRSRGRRAWAHEQLRRGRSIPALAGPTLADLQSYQRVCRFSFSCFPAGR